MYVSIQCFTDIKHFIFSDIASKDLPINEAIESKLFSVFGDKEIFKIQFEAFSNKILPKLQFKSRTERLKNVKSSEDLNDADLTNYYDSSSPSTDLSDVCEEFKKLSDNFEALRKKYIFKR